MNLPLLPVEIIKKTRDGKSLSAEEIQYFVLGYTNGEIPDYQMSAWLMAIILKGLRSDETLSLTRAMLDSGSKLNLSSLNMTKVDKHSTGGIGDKTSLILGPIVAGCGVAVPMMSGRGLGHTGGTLDKLESIPGFNTQLNETEFIEILRKHAVGFIGQTASICPADKKMYALRDVTGTVESLELISASIMSKKLAEDLDGLVLDVKFGSGAFMKTSEQAKRLALSLQSLGKGDGKKVTALITNMNQPLGAYIGNALETFECLEILRGKSLVSQTGTDLYADTRELSLILAAHMLLLGGKVDTLIQAKAAAEHCLNSGKALQIFEAVCQAQGGDLTGLPCAEYSLDVWAKTSGFIESFDGEKVGMLAIKLGAGRVTVTDSIDPIAGFKVHVKIGDKITAGEPLWTIYGSSLSQMQALETELLATIRMSTDRPALFELIKEVLF
jgi:pyrimidine-nucleoside phosphorylase